MYSLGWFQVGYDEEGYESEAPTDDEIYEPSPRKEDDNEASFKGCLEGEPIVKPIEMETNVEENKGAACSKLPEGTMAKVSGASSLVHTYGWLVFLFEDVV